MGAMSIIDAVGIVGVVVFAVSGALAAGRHRMDPIGFILLGTPPSAADPCVTSSWIGRFSGRKLPNNC